LPSHRVLIDTKKLALRLAAVASAKKAEELTVLDVRKIAGFCDFFVIVSANSLRQVNAIGQAIEEELAALGIKPLSRIPSNDESGWIAVDVGSIIVHAFYKPTREFYALERLWSDAVRLRLPRTITA